MSREEKLAEFVGWAQQHITGDEKGQAQIFLDRLFQLLALNFEVAGKIERSDPVTAPGVPKNYPDAKELVTTDCIRPQVLV